MILKDYAVDIPYDKGGIVIKKEKWVEMEVERLYSSENKNTRVQRKVIGQVVPLFPGKMYPNENYFSLVVPNSVPEEIRDDFLRRCERKRELAELKKDPERMMRQVEAGIRFLKDAEIAVGGTGQLLQRSERKGLFYQSADDHQPKF